MLANLVVALAVLVGFAALLLVVAWLLDLIWMTFMQPWVPVVVVLSFAVLFTISGDIVAASNLKLVLAVALTTLVVRPLIDLLMWLYDMSRLEVVDHLPFVLLADRDEYQARMSDTPPQWEWDYFRERCRAVQEVSFRETVIFSDGPADDEKDERE